MNMTGYQIINMIVDDEFSGEEYVTAEIVYDQEVYSITFQKADLELMNAWLFKDGTSLPASLPEDLIDTIREEVQKRI
jgi:hypothetical protein